MSETQALTILIAEGAPSPPVPASAKERLLLPKAHSRSWMYLRMQIPNLSRRKYASASVLG